MTPSVATAPAAGRRQRAAGRRQRAAERRQRAAEALLAGYKRVLSPLLHLGSPTQCRYLPTCSEYAVVAVSRYGWWRGGALALRRLARCHPLGRGGLDPVP